MTKTKPPIAARPITVPRLSASDALSQGYSAFAGPYAAGEDWMLQNLIKDLARGHRAFCLVEGYDYRGLTVFLRLSANDLAYEEAA